MPKRKSSILCDFEGTVGFLNLWTKTDSGRMKPHPASRAKVKIITNRYSGLEVEMLQDLNGYRVGERLIVGPSDFVMNASDLKDYANREESSSVAEQRRDSRKSNNRKAS